MNRCMLKGCLLLPHADLFCFAHAPENDHMMYQEELPEVQPE